MFFRQRWYDERLHHDLDEPLVVIVGVQHPTDIVWVPDTVFINSAVSSMHHVTVNHHKLDIYPNGTVFWGTRSVTCLECVKLTFENIENISVVYIISWYIVNATIWMKIVIYDFSWNWNNSANRLSIPRSPANFLSDIIIWKLRIVRLFLDDGVPKQMLI